MRGERVGRDAAIGAPGQYRHNARVNEVEADEERGHLGLGARHVRDAAPLSRGPAGRRQLRVEEVRGEVRDREVAA